MRKLSKDYLAGIFDGEGFFTIRKSTPSTVKMGKRPMRLQAVVSVIITEKYICDALATEFGGYVRIQNPKKPIQHSTYHIWNLTGPKIINFCNKMIPLLTIKKERAMLIHKFQTIKSSVGNQPISDVTYAQTVEMYTQFRTLNKRGQS
jgi:hypothetical protein